MTVSPPLQVRTRRPPPRKRSHRGRWISLAVVVGVVVAAAAVVWAFSGASLATDRSALGRVDLQPFAGRLVSVDARAANGRVIPLTVLNGRITPRRRISPGERITLSVVVRRPGWAGWALGAERRETLTVKAPAAHVASRWVTVARDGHAQVRFDAPIDRVSLARATVVGRTVTLPTRTAAGAIEIAAAARPWETLGEPVRITWFPRASRPVVLAEPGPNARANPLAPIRLTFSKPVSRVLRGKEPTLVPPVPGRWTTPDDHTLLFQPGGNGAPFNSDLVVRFPSPVAVMSAHSAAHVTKSFRLTVAPASFLRLQQLLAQEGYLPVDWTPARAGAPLTMRRPARRGRRPACRALHLALPGHAARAAGAVEDRRAERDHARCRDDVPGRAPPRRRRDRRPEGVAHAARRRRRRQAPNRRLQLRLRAPEPCRSS